MIGNGEGFMRSFDRCNRERFFRSIIALFILVASSALAGAADKRPTGLLVELKQGTHLVLHITLTSAAEKAVKVSRDELPWGTHYSMVIVAALAGGRCLNRTRPVEDPPFDKISLDPDQPLIGDVDLETLFPDIRRALKESDVQLFWAYEAPESLRIPHWSGGWISIPKQQIRRRR